MPSEIGTSPKISPVAHAEHSVDAVDDANRLDSAFQHREQRPRAALRRGVLALHQSHVGGGAGQLFALREIELGKQRYGGDFLGRYQR